MARYILIDNHTGYIFGDTADLNGRNVYCESITDAARALDEEVVREFGRTYSEVTRSELNGRCGYYVYRADINGSEAVPVVHDGQDKDTIENVMDACRYEGAVLCESSPD